MCLKKIVSLATCAIIAATVFTGCGSSDKGATAGKDGVTTLTWYTIGGEPEDLDMVLAEANKYLGEKINVNLNLKFIGYGDYSQKMSVIINSGEKYDMAFTCSWAADYVGNARKGAFLDVEPYLDTLGKEMKGAIDERFWEGARVDGKIYAVPNQKELGLSPRWVFTKEYVDKYKIPYEEIHTLEDLEPWLKVIKENEPDVTPLFSNNFSFNSQFDQIASPLGIEFGAGDDYKLVNIYETETMKKNLDTIRRFYELGYINMDSATADDDTTIKRFVTKGDGQPFAETVWSKNLKKEVVSSPIVDTWITNSSATGAMIGISKNSPNKEKAIEFLNLLNTDEYIRNLLCFGLEDVHYKKTGDKRIELINADDSKYNMSYIATGNLFETYVIGDEPDNKWEVFQQFNDEAKVSPLLGFNFNAENVTNEIAAINNVLDEYGRVLFSGSVPINENLNKMNEKLKQQGLEKVKKEVQTQLDAWVKENDKK